MLIRLNRANSSLPLTLSLALVRRYRLLYLFALSSHCRDDNEIVPQVLTAVLQLPDTTHVALRYTSILLVGGLSDWIEKHPDVLGESTSCFLVTFRGFAMKTKFKKSEFTMEVGGWVQVSLGFFFFGGISTQNWSKPVMIFWSMFVYVHC